MKTGSLSLFSSMIANLGLLLLGSPDPSSTDEIEPAQIVIVTGPLVPWISTRDRALPSSIETMRQSEPTLDQFAHFVTELVNGQTEEALKLQAKVTIRSIRRWVAVEMH